jgi:NAD(P)-dependent dehydrogenase (short-subunit alcohol dehydrogenase family)
MTTSLTGRVAIITGAGQGIGRAFAKAFAAEGAIPIIAERYRERGEAVAAEITAAGGQARAVTTDVADPDSVAAMANTVEAEFGRVDILINNAAIFSTLEMRPFDQIPLEEWRQVMDVNVASMFLACRAAVPVMRERGGGKIVNISSGTPFRGVPFMLHYVTSKGAIVALTRALAKELGKDGILVNCVAPGFTMTEGVEANPKIVEKLRDVSIAGRTLQRDQVAEDVVGAVVYLCSPASDFVTGQTIVIDGGQYFH